MVGVAWPHALGHAPCPTKRTENDIDAVSFSVRWWWGLLGLTLLDVLLASGGQESYPLHIFILGRSGLWAVDGGRWTVVGGARVVSGAEKKSI